MYRVGELGDCFLLQFETESKKSAVLIDCGSFRNSKSSVTRMNQVADDIIKTLGKDSLSVVVGTHQHNDHLSGFTHAAAKWKKLGAQEAWLSWLDDPLDNGAVKVSQEHKKLWSTLEEVGKALVNSKDDKFTKDQSTEKIADVLGFYLGATETNDPIVPLMGLNTIREMSKKVKYLSPGKIFDLPGLDPGEVKVYVLGPPRNKKQLFDITAGKDESYDHKLAMANTMANNYLKALSNFSPRTAPDCDEDYFPFDNKYHRSCDDGIFSKGLYNSTANKWRKIDTDWLKQAERLGLYLDSYTNNTSLVLAFELVQSGKILLFVGDAQTGNWLSWKDIDWKDQEVGFSIDKIYAKTVLYKVGHHCSHNATLVAGLEAMTHQDLVAMIPVDRTDPNITKENGWKMPASKLYQRLKEKTSKRILMMDTIYADDCDPQKVPEAAEAWKKVAPPVPHDLYIEYTVHG